MEIVSPQVARFRAMRVDMHPLERHWSCACGVAGDTTASVNCEPWCPTFKTPALYAVAGEKK